MELCILFVQIDEHRRELKVAFMQEKGLAPKANGNRFCDFAIF